MSDALAGLDFSEAMSDVKKGLLLKPLMQTYFNNGKFPKHTMKFENTHDLAHGPDGWFHPSTHPTWNEKQLYTYLVHPQMLRQERMDYVGYLNVTIGSAMHSFLQCCMGKMGLLPKDLQQCQSCLPARKCKEPGYSSQELNERGHLDGILALPGRARGGDIFEFKTSGPKTKLSQLEDLDLEGLKRVAPYYYHQQLAYQRLSGIHHSVMFVMTLGHPWPMKEFHIPFNLADSNEIVAKYRSVLQRAADQRPPLCMCPKSKVNACPAAGECSKL